MHLEKFPSVFGGHLISMTIPPRKEEPSYNYSLRVGERLGVIIGVRSLPLL
jgi:hypothetical protein